MSSEEPGTETAPPSLLKRCYAELCGVFALVTVGCGAIVVNAQTGELGHLGISLAFGLIITIMVAATGHVSGAHLNPAVTVAFSVMGLFRRSEILAYLTAQVLGAVLGAATLLVLFGAETTLGSTVPSGSPWQSLLAETLLTAGLMFSITAVATGSHVKATPAAIVIGAAVAVGALWGGPVSGASMNPARSFGPALISGTWDHHWIYWMGPILGAVLGGLAYRLLEMD